MDTAEWTALLFHMQQLMSSALRRSVLCGVECYRVGGVVGRYTAMKLRQRVCRCCGGSCFKPYTLNKHVHDWLTVDIKQKSENTVLRLNTGVKKWEQVLTSNDTTFRPL